MGCDFAQLLQNSKQAALPVAVLYDAVALPLDALTLLAVISVAADVASCMVFTVCVLVRIVVSVACVLACSVWSVLADVALFALAYATSLAVLLIFSLFVMATPIL